MIMFVDIELDNKRLRSHELLPKLKKQGVGALLDLL